MAGISETQSVPWYCTWLWTCKNKKLDAVTGAVPAPNKEPAKAAIADKKKPKAPSFPLTACGATEGDYDICTDMPLSVDTAKTGAGKYEIGTFDCNGPITGAVIYADLDGDGTYTVLAEDTENTGKIAIDVSSSAKDSNIIYLVRENMGEKLSAQDIKDIAEKKAIEVWTKDAAASTTAPVSTCQSKDYYPTSGALTIIPDPKKSYNGMAYVNSFVRVELNGAKACDNTTGNLTYEYQVAGSIVTFEPDKEPVISAGNNQVSAGYNENGNPYIDISIPFASSYPVTVYVTDTIDVGDGGDPIVRTASTTGSIIVIPDKDVTQTTETTTQPTASIVGPYVAYAGDETFFAAGSPAGTEDQDLYTYAWDFGVAGKTAEGPLPDAVVYDQAGTYTVMLTVTSKENPSQIAVTTQKLTVVPKPETQKDQCDYQNNAPTITSGLSVTNGSKFTENDPVDFSLTLMDCDQDNQDIVVKLVLPEGEVKMLPAGTDSAGTTFQLPDVPAAQWGQPMAANIYKIIDGKEVWVATSLLYNVPTVVPPGDPSIEQTPCEKLNNGPSAISGLTIPDQPAVVNNKVKEGDMVTFELKYIDCDGENNDISIELSLNGKTTAMQDDGAGNWTGALAADYFWSPPAIATVTKDGVVIASVQLWNLPIVMPKNQTTIIANITADPNNADVDGGAMVTLNATGTMVFDGGDKVQNPVLTYTLNYDDNTSQINNTGIFTRYFSTGNHSLTLVVTDDQGHSDSQQITVSLW